MTRTVRWLAIALALSLSLNLLVGGVIIGHRLAGREAILDGRGGALRVLTMAGLDRSIGVPPDLRPEIRQRLLSDRKDAFRRVQEIQQARRAASDALSARPFDPKAAEAALLTLREEVDAGLATVFTAVVETMAEAEAAGTLPPPPQTRPRPTRESTP